jgi:hypothetical protein
MTDITKKYKKTANTLSIVSWALTFVPIIVYVIVAFANGTPAQKLTLGISVIIAGMLVAVNFMMKLNLRSTIWVLMLGVYVCLKNILPLLLIIALSTIIDEMIISPLAKSYKNKYVINKEIDKRG